MGEIGCFDAGTDWTILFKDQRMESNWNHQPNQPLLAFSWLHCQPVIDTMNRCAHFTLLLLSRCPEENVRRVIAQVACPLSRGMT